jgi:hypothetical protein
VLAEQHALDGADVRARRCQMQRSVATEIKFVDHRPVLHQRLGGCATRGVSRLRVRVKLMRLIIIGTG